MTTDELKAAAAARALELAMWMFPEGWREKSEWLAPINKDERTPIFAINVGLRPGRWKDLVGETTGDDFVSLYALAFNASAEAAKVDIARQLGVALDEPDPEVAPHPADVERPARVVTEPVLRTGPAQKAALARLLPAAPDAEKGVLSCFIRDPVNTGLICVKKALLPEHFHTPAHAELYDHLLFLFGERMPCDIVTLTTHFDSNGRLAAVGGAAYISELFTYAPTLANTEHWLDLLDERKAARDLIKLTGDYHELGYQGRGLDARTLIAEFKEKADALGGKRGVDRLPALDSVADWEAEENLPAEPPLVIQGVLHRGSKLIISAPSKARKSWTLLDMAASIAAGEPWWGIPTVKGRVLYLNFEVQKPFISRRIRWICKKRGLPMTSNLQVMTLRGITTPIEQLADELIAYILACDPFSLIVVDPVFKLMAGRDENKVGDVMVILQNLEKIAVRTGAAIAIAHHYSKGNQAAKESIDRMGGSGAFARDPDAILMMTTHEEEDCFTIEPTLRNFAPVKPFVVRWSAPVFERAPGLDPEALKQPKKPERTSRSEAPRDTNGEPVPRPSVRSNDVVQSAKDLLAPFFKEQTAWRYTALEKAIITRRLCALKTFERWWMRLRKDEVVVVTAGMAGYLEPSKEWGIELGIYADDSEPEPENQ